MYPGFQPSTSKVTKLVKLVKVLVKTLAYPRIYADQKTQSHFTSSTSKLEKLEFDLGSRFKSASDGAV
eukprot:783335-Amorphochlora_amoeboformis.AAC.1